MRYLGHLYLFAFSILTSSGYAHPVSTNLPLAQKKISHPVHPLKNNYQPPRTAINTIFISDEIPYSIKNTILTGSTLAGKASLCWNLKISGAHVTLEQSADGKHFSFLYRLHSRELNGRGYYSENILVTKYYRLRISNTGGRLQYSNVVKLEGRQQKLFVVPNPADSSATIFVEGMADGVYTAFLKDGSGRLYTCRFHVQGETGSMVPPLPTAFKGTLWIHFTDEQGKIYPGGKLVI